MCLMPSSNKKELAFPQLLLFSVHVVLAGRRSSYNGVGVCTCVLGYVIVLLYDVTK